MAKDHDLRQAGLDELAWKPSVTAAHLGVTVKSGVVTLTGHVETFFEKSAAEQATLARHGDLLVTGIPLHDTNDPTRAAGGDLVMQCGRPVLVVRQAPATPSLDHVMMAWKDTRKARSTALNALPLPNGQRTSPSWRSRTARTWRARQCLADVSRWLAGHGITAEVIAVASSDGDDAQFERLAYGSGANLIVTGAYGHSRLPEWAVGGVIRTLPQSGDRCAMLSH